MTKEEFSFDLLKTFYVSLPIFQFLALIFEFTTISLWVILHMTFSFQKVDFYGHAPGTFRKQSSTVIFKSTEKCFLFERKIKLKSSEELCTPL